jgi:hypothetical protein
MSDTGESRLEAARRQVQTARILVAALSLAAFGGVVAAAKASYPATATVQPRGYVQSEDESDGFDFGTGAIGPSTGAEPSFGTRSS